MPAAPVNTTWNGSNDNWNTANDWSAAAVPGANANVTISSGQPQITADEGMILSLSVDGSLAFVNGALQVTNGTNNTGTFNVDATGFGQGGSQLTIGATLTNSGTFILG